MTHQRLTERSPLWLWISVRVVALAVGTAIVVGFCMWLRIAIWNAVVMRRMPEPDRIELQQLVADPRHDPHRLVQLVDQYYGLEFVYPQITNGDWLTLAMFVLASVPLIMLFGWSMSRSASRQFSQVTHAAREVARGNFSARAALVAHAPEEFRELALDFNEMTLRLERNEREVRDSSAILAHELRTPLNAAMGRLQGMIDGVFPPDPQQLQRVLGRLDLLHRLVDDMHLLSLARAGRLVLNKNRFQLSELIGECLSWVTPQIEGCAVRVRRQLTLALVVEADRDRLGQVFSILIDNTLRYAADGGRLNIHASSDADRVTIDFSDRGPGIDPEHLPRMFDRFWRAEHSRARHSGGSGLGLSIASAICSAHGGSITAINRKGGGTTVRVTLPRAWVSIQRDPQDTKEDIPSRTGARRR